MKSKKMVLVVYISSFKTDTRYFGVEDEKNEINKSPRAIAFINSLQGAIWKKNLRNRAINTVKVKTNSNERLT